VTRATLVVGTGYVGQRFLAQQGNESAIGLSRSPMASTHQTGLIDLDAGTPLPLTLPGQYAVLYTVPPSDKSLSDVRLEHLLGALKPGPERFVYISTTGVYGNRDGAAVDEETPVNAESDRASRRVAAELALQSWGAEHDCSVVILRVPGIYGPGRLGVERIRDGMPVIEESDTGPGNRIHVDDLVNCCVAALAADAPEGIYNVGDGDKRSSTWFSNEVARQCSLPAPPTISMQEAGREFSPMRMSFIRESRSVSTQKMRDVLGVTPKYANAEDGIRASLKPQG
jgi:nucleoside-diphosphate-sugar epimerase